MQGLFPCPFPNPVSGVPNPVPGVSQSRSWRLPIPPRLSARTAAGLPVFTVALRRLRCPIPAPAFSSDGSGSASFYRCAPAAAQPYSRPGRFFLSPPPGFSPIPFRSLFSNPAPAAFRSAWEPIQRRRSGGPFPACIRPELEPFPCKNFRFRAAGLDGIPAKWYRMILVGGWRIAVHAAGRIHSPAAHAANPSFSTAPRNKYAPAGRHTRAAFAPQRNVRWEELHCRTFWICSPT